MRRLRWRLALTFIRWADELLAPQVRSNGRADKASEHLCRAELHVAGQLDRMKMTDGL